MKNTVEFSSYLAPTRFIDSDNPLVIQFAKETGYNCNTDIEKAVKLYYAVRDGIVYDPYRFSLAPDDLMASTVLKIKAAFCVPKAVLLAAAARTQGIPSRLGFADVKNHLSSERLRKMMGTDVFAFHGYTEMYLEGKWVKATPAFNLSLCRATGVFPLEFDGKSDSVFQQYNVKGNRHIEYIFDRGHYPDLPYEEMLKVFADFYAPLMSGITDIGNSTGNFEEDMKAEREQDQTK